MDILDSLSKILRQNVQQLSKVLDEIKPLKATPYKACKVLSKMSKKKTYRGGKYCCCVLTNPNNHYLPITRGPNYPHAEVLGRTRNFWRRFATFVADIAQRLQHKTLTKKKIYRGAGFGWTGQGQSEKPTRQTAREVITHSATLLQI